MSVRALNWAFDQKGMQPASKLLLIALANHADDSGYAWPGIEGIADRWDMSPRTVSRHIHLLSIDGLISVSPRYRDNGSQTSNAYQLSMTPLTDCHPPPDTGVIPPMTAVSPPEPSLETTVETSTLPTWLAMLANEQPLDEKTATVILGWAEDYPEADLQDMAVTVVLKWPEYKRKNKSIFATFKNWYRRNLTSDVKLKSSYRNGTAKPQTSRDSIELAARIQEAGHHPASPEAQAMRQEARDGVREST